MAITVVESSPYRQGFALNGTSADLSGCEELKAAPAAGTAIYIEKIAISCASGITITIGEGETTGSVTTVIIGPITFTAAGSNSFSHTFVRPIKLSDATSLTVDSSGAGTATVFVEGFVS